jgi:hypothetical protein
MGLVMRFQQAPEVLLRTVPRRSARRGIVFCDVQSSARRSARGAGNHRLRSEFLPQDIRRNFAIPWLPLDRGSQFFRLFGNRVLETAFVLRDGPLAPSPSPSEVRPFEPRCQQHRGSLHLRLRCLGIPLPRPTARRPGAHRARSSRILQAGFQLRKNPEQYALGVAYTDCLRLLLTGRQGCRGWGSRA